MAIKIRCVDCKKKISIDEAFAGGVCRCPYCTAIVYVPDESNTKKSKKGRAEAPKRRPEAPRPEAPVPVTAATISSADTAVGVDPNAGTAIDPPRPADPNAATAIDAPPVDVNAQTAIETPQTPRKPKPLKTASQEEADRAMAAAHGQANIPTAAPVKLQGIIAIIFAILLLGMLAGIVVMAIYLTQPRDIGDPPKDHENTAFTTKEFPAVAGTIKVTAPVVYCIDTSRPMGEVFEPACNIVIASAKSLKGGKFNIILLGEADDKTLSPQPIAADKAGIDKARKFLEMDLCGAAEQARGLKAALDMKAKTVVLLARDSAFGAGDVAKGDFKTKSVQLHTVILASKSRGLEEMAKATGGKSRAFTTSELEQQAKRAAEQLKNK